jgi:amino acid transporter
MTALQLLAITLAVVAAMGFGQSGHLLGEEGRGWPNAPIGVSIALWSLAVFWLAAAVYAAGHAAIVGVFTLALASLFALVGVATLAGVLRRRPGRGSDRWAGPRR